MQHNSFLFPNNNTYYTPLFTYFQKRTLTDNGSGLASESASNNYLRPLQSSAAILQP